MSDAKTETTTSTPAPTPKLADGLFKPFTLGSTLEQTPSGNAVANLRRSPMDYEKAYQGSTKNQSLSPEDLSKIGEVKKAVEAPMADATLLAVPAEQRDAVIAEMDRRIEEAKKSKDDAAVDKIQKAKDRAKKCWGPQMDHKQPKAADLK